jgi:hypothetical protein
MLYLGSWSGTSTYSNKWSIYQESTTEKNYFGSAVLIGTNTNSGYKLDVSGTGRFSSSVLATGTLKTKNNSSNISYLEFERYSNTQAFSLIEGNGENTTGWLKFYTSDTNRLTILGNGNVGIGTSTPSSYGYFAVANVITVNSTTGVAAGFSDAVNGTLRIYIQSGVNGINTDQAFAISTGGTSALAERMRITSAGQIQETTSIADWSHTIRNSSSSSPNGMLISYDNANKNNTGNQFLYCVDNFGGSLRMSVRSNGGIENYATNNIPLSDERLKKDITPLESVWDKIKNIEIVKYKFKDQTHDDFNMGVIAQQVQKVAPELVDDEGWGTFAEDGTTYKGIWETDLNYYSIKALQEAMAKIESLQEQINELKNK